MGFPADVRVLAWGLSLERPTMIKYHVSNIRELFGHRFNLAKSAAAPICRYPDSGATYALDERLKPTTETEAPAAPSEAAAAPAVPQ